MLDGDSLNMLDVMKVRFITYEDGTHKVYRNVGIYNSAAAQLPIRKHTTKYEQLDRSRSTAAASRHTCCSERRQAHIPAR